ncbi:MAG: hypothetical protein PVG27_12955 [Chloroflexota bacterium]|jgi:hypothetical protein
MNDERFLKDWLRETTDDTQDPQASADRVLARVPKIRQRSRWWPWLPVRRTRPQPIDDDPPTIQGRTRLMLSPVKAITAGTLVLAISAAFLVAQPFDQQGSAPGAEQAAEPLAPVYVTGETLDRRCEGETDPVVEGPVERSYGTGCEILKDWSDPRLAGIDWRNNNGTLYDLADGDRLGIYYDVHVITTDEGAWRSRPQIAFDFPGVPDISDFPRWWVLDGEGAHEGLSLLLFSAPNEILSGYIVSTDLLPPAPEVSSTS